MQVAPMAAVASNGRGNSLRNRADSAAAATLAVLLPHMASNDTAPLLDRSAVFAGDISRLLANYDLNQAPGARLTGLGASDENNIQRLLRGAMALMGTPYRWGGTSPESGFDCSGLVGYVFRNALGIELPRISHDMANTGKGNVISDPSQLTPGDLVFFGRRGHVNHVGIYVGEGRFLHAPSTGKDVRIDSMASGYWSARFMQARRLDI
ncbi:MAG: C40 family peptidase [Xanthomonadaceae bacterium]|nr:C40 family peptidase [Xanthomonadaceae bacterium]